MLDARNFFAPPTEDAPVSAEPVWLLARRAGADGSHILFVDYDGTRSAKGITRVTNVPTLAERSEIFRRASSQSRLILRPVNASRAM